MPGRGDWPVPITNHGAGMNMAQWVSTYEKFANDMMMAGWNIQDVKRIVEEAGETFPKSLLASTTSKNALFPGANMLFEYDLDNKMKRSFPHKNADYPEGTGYGEWVPMEADEIAQQQDYYNWKEDHANYSMIDNQFQGNAYNAWLANSRGNTTALVFGKDGNTVKNGASKAGSGVSNLAPSGPMFDPGVSAMSYAVGDLAQVSAAEERLNLAQQQQRVNERNLAMAGYAVNPDMQAGLDMDRSVLGYRNTTARPSMISAMGVNGTQGANPYGASGYTYTPGPNQDPAIAAAIQDLQRRAQTSPGSSPTTPGDRDPSGNENQVVSASSYGGVRSMGQPIYEWDGGTSPTTPPLGTTTPPPRTDVHGGPAQPPIRVNPNDPLGNTTAFDTYGFPDPNKGAAATQPYNVNAIPTQQGSYELTHQSFDPDNIRADAFYNPEIERIRKSYDNANQELMNDPEVRRGGAMAASKANMRQQRLGALTDVYRSRTEDSRARLSNFAQSNQFQQPVFLNGGQNALEGRAQDMNLLNSREQRVSDAWTTANGGNANKLSGYLNLAGQLGSAYLNSRKS